MVAINKGRKLFVRAKTRPFVGPPNWGGILLAPCATIEYPVPTGAQNGIAAALGLDRFLSDRAPVPGAGELGKSRFTHWPA